MGECGSGGGIRTHDLRVMSPTTSFFASYWPAQSYTYPLVTQVFPVITMVTMVTMITTIFATICYIERLK